MDHKSFTLIEVLLALFITAILITILSVVFNTALKSYRQGKDLMEITRKGQLVLGQITRELPGAMVQKVGTTTYIPFEGTGNYVCFMAPVDNSSNSNVDLCEIGYIWDSNNKKFNRHFYTADASSNNYEYPGAVDYEKTSGLPDGVEFCTNIKGFSLQYYDPSGSPHWDSSWNDSSHTSRLPAMVEISVTIQGEYSKNAPAQEKTFTTWVYLPNSTNI